MRNFLSISCAFSAAYRARTGPHHTVRIPQYMVRKFRRQWCGNSARSVHFRCISCDFRRSFCASARSCAEIPHGPIRKLVSIWFIYILAVSGRFLWLSKKRCSPTRQGTVNRGSLTRRGTLIHGSRTHHSTNQNKCYNCWVLVLTRTALAALIPTGITRALRRRLMDWHGNVYLWHPSFKALYK